ncbi:hypothetical protein ACQRXC_26815 (plasmid) [Niallia taxi]|uniref:Uncharacterized protein n=2 Tax=Bacteria TaxID=2 RepID=A0A437K434_9BACI|nr:hypothetical protein [Niallia taxi]MDK8643282.1 hypothetical protein [Niallia taxi]MED4057625.1 hypothetical protein [Niallia taxi]RVT57047.1 hypothetical protein EM808_25715 [Niallia taxi]
MKVAENKQKRQDTTILDVLFSSFKSNDLPIIDIMPYKRVTKEGFLIDKQNEYQAYLRVKTNDLVSMNNSDLNRMISQLTSICRVYTEPFKILSMTYSTETSKQQMFWKSRINKYRRVLMADNVPESEMIRHEVMLRLAVDNLRRVTWVEDNLTELTFFIVVYEKSQKELELRVRDMTRLGGKQYDLQLVERDNIENILIRLNNMNTEV